MHTKNTFDIIIIGGGLAGLCNAIHLAKNNKKVVVIEKNSYKKHKVCGEYISNEVLPYLKYLGINPFAFGAVKIDTFTMSTTTHKTITTKLPLGGFGISRYLLDYKLYKKALELGVTVVKDTAVDVCFKTNMFSVATKSNGNFKSVICIGAFGKRSLLDVKLHRSFIKNKSPYLGVKLHVKGNFKDNEVALHNFKGGYCGVSKVEHNTINLCYITSYKAFKKHKTIANFEEQVVFKNAFLKTIFKEATPLWKQPLSISQISFDTKKPVEKNIIMCGDAAGMIHPLCGNGMSMAIQSAQLAAPLILNYLDDKTITRANLEKQYIKKWQKQFKWRLKAGHVIAALFRQHTIASILLQLLQKLRFLLPLIIKQTHGKPII